MGGVTCLTLCCLCRVGWGWRVGGGSDLFNSALFVGGGG